MAKKIILLFYLVLALACANSKEKETQKGTITLQNDKTNTVVTNIGELLTEESRALVEGWKEYQILNKELNSYYNISTKEALFKAKDISTYAQELKDSIRIELLDRPDVKIRLNVFYNSALRLSDMETIRTIESDEVKVEIAKMLNSFSSINSKINNIVLQNNLEKELIDFKQ